MMLLNSMEERAHQNISRINPFTTSHRRRGFRAQLKGANMVAEYSSGERTVVAKLSSGERTVPIALTSEECTVPATLSSVQRTVMAEVLLLQEMESLPRVHGRNLHAIIRKEGPTVWDAKECKL